MDWDKLKTFYVVANSGTFTDGAKLLSLSQSAVSRQISALEEGLGTPLFNRHARGLILTEQGETLYKTVENVFSKLTETEEILRESKKSTSGPLTVALPSSLFHGWLSSRIHRFMEKHPHISLNIKTENKDLKLHMREADVALRLSESSQSDVIQRPLHTISLCLYGSKKYIKKYGIPKTLEDLKSHKVIYNTKKTSSSPLNENWPFHLYEQKTARNLPLTLKANGFFNIYSLVRNSLGLGVLPSYMENICSDFIPLLSEEEKTYLSIFYLYPVELRNSKKVKVFQEFLTKELIRP